MTKLSEFKPTAFDSSPAEFFDDGDPRREWLMAPVSQTRDSDALAKSNFASCLAILGGESDTVEVHRFDHWGPGWFEVIICDPSLEPKLYELEHQLENYPVLDDEDFSKREWEGFMEDWDNWARWDFRRELIEKFELSDKAADMLDDADFTDFREFFMECNECGDYYDSEGVNIARSVDGCEREDMARYLRKLRGVRT